MALASCLTTGVSIGASFAGNYSHALTIAVIAFVLAVLARWAEARHKTALGRQLVAVAAGGLELMRKVAEQEPIDPVLAAAAIHDTSTRIEAFRAEHGLD